MLPGPVFNVELVTTARRARYFALRFIYGAILLAVVWQNDPAHYGWYYNGTDGEFTLEQAATLGYTLFGSFAVAQSIAVLLITPAFVAGVIAEEKQRKTLHYLMASRLTSGEIVLGKLYARLLHVGVLLGVGLPVLSLLTLFGGVPPELIALTFGVTITTVFFVGSLAILVSVYARRPREAIGMAYVLEATWLFLPKLVALTMPYGSALTVRIYQWIRPVNELLATSSPVHLLTSASMWMRGGSGTFDTYTWMVGLQGVGGVLFLLLAVARLRPVFRKQGDTSRWATRFTALKHGRRLLPRPDCGDDPMLWKERYVSRTSLATKIVGGFVVAIAGVAIAYATYEFAAPAFVELYHYGYGAFTQNHERRNFNWFVRTAGVLGYLVWILSVASAASGGIVHEREADTWTSLIATPLTGHDVVLAKMIGPVWATRWVGAVLLIIESLGVAAGAVHPLGLIATTVETVAFIWFAAALGTAISLRSKNSGRAITTTIGILMLLNGGYLLCCIPLRADTPLMVVGVTPALQAISLITYEVFVALFGAAGNPYTDRHVFEAAFTCVTGTLGYGIAALMLTASSVGRFDELVDRPRRLGQYPPPGRSRAPAPASSEGITFVE